MKHGAQIKSTNVAGAQIKSTNGVMLAVGVNTTACVPLSIKHEHSNNHYTH